MLGKEIEQVNEFFKLVDGKHDGRVAWNRIKTALAELGTTPNTGSPKLPDDIKEKFQRWCDEQTSFPREFVKIVNDNFWDLL